MIYQHLLKIFLKKIRNMVLFEKKVVILPRLLQKTKTLKYREKNGKEKQRSTPASDFGVH